MTTLAPLREEQPRISQSIIQVATAGMALQTLHNTSIVKDTRGRLGYDGPLESVGRVSLQERIDRWTGQGMAWLVRKLVAMLLRNVAPVSSPRPDVTHAAIPLHRDPWCGTYVSHEIAFPLEQAGQVIYFCSTDCRARYQQSSQRAASA